MRGHPIQLLLSGLTAILLPMLAGCNSETFLNQTASVGGDTAGTPGGIDVGFINNTPVRAVFTYG
ncbi:MAG: hypothetical protein ACE5GE_00745, partial [Phycisphaerae bacterium]